MSSLVLLAAGSWGVAGATLVWSIRRPSPALARRVQPYTIAARTALGCPPDHREASGRSAGSVLTGPLRDAARAISRLIESSGDDAIRRRLYQAGRADLTPDELRMQQIIRAVLWGAAFAAFGFVVMPRSPLVAMGLAVAGFTFGAARVRARIDRAIADRAERMELELATVNQLLALHVRSGSGPIQAVQRLVARGHGDVVDELRELLAWIRAGVREADAFRRAAEVTPCRAAARTYHAFAAAAERGSDLAEGLLAVSADLRDARREGLRRQTVRRRAAMLAPTIGVLAPIMLLFVAAPLPSIVFGNR